MSQSCWHGGATGKPVFIQETFPLKYPIDQFDAFVDQSRTVASGWLSFYWGRALKTAEECRQGKTSVDALTAEWLTFF